MTNEKTTYIELNLAKKSKKQHTEPKGTKGFTPETEREITYAELHLQNATRESFQENAQNHPCKGPPSPPEKLIAGVLGMTCFVLICIVAYKLKFLIGEQYSEQTRSQKDQNFSQPSHCGHCPPEGFTYSNNCYFTSHERKPWNESVMACAALRSHLLYVESEEEEKLLVSISPPFWVGAWNGSSVHPWMARCTSTSNQRMKENSVAERNCAVLFSSGYRPESCRVPYLYYCKRKLQN